MVGNQSIVRDVKALSQLAEAENIPKNIPAQF